MEVITRQRAKAESLPHYFTGKPCKRGHICPRQTRNGCCMECNSHHERQRYVRDPDYYSEKSRKWSEQNTERKSELRREWNRKNADHKKALQAAWLEKNRERKLLKQKEWAAANLANVNERAAKRRALVRQALVPLTSHERKQVRDIYVLRNKLSRETGIEYEVDHRIPLSRGGKHHPSNLWVITADENRRKWAHMPPEAASHVAG